MNTEIPKDVIIDTNLVISLQLWSKNRPELFSEFFSFLKKLNLRPVINNTIKYESLMSANNAEELAKRMLWLEKFPNHDDKMDLQIPHTHKFDLLSRTIEISNLYNNKGIAKNQISVGDCEIAAYVSNYPNSVLIATQDLKDFPLVIFDRPKVFIIDLGYNPQSKNKTCDDGFVKIGILKFNENKYKQLKIDFSKSS